MPPNCKHFGSITTIFNHYFRKRFRSLISRLSATFCYYFFIAVLKTTNLLLTEVWKSVTHFRKFALSTRNHHLLISSLKQLRQCSAILREYQKRGGET
jgi:hypothetical protein